MYMLEITALSNGAHRNQTFHGVLPNGWALDRLNLCKENFPFGEVTAEEIDGVMTVTMWTPLPVPEVEEVPAEPTELEKLRTDVDELSEALNMILEGTTE